MNRGFEFKFSCNVIEHLGLRLYQNKPHKIFAEYISNAWDAEAHHVDIRFDSEDSPTGVAITDDGYGMTRDEVCEHFLAIGANRRKRPLRVTGTRKPMGRKGLGKLAVFGIAKVFDVVTTARDDTGELGLVWLRFSLDEMRAQTAASLEVVSYRPRTLACGPAADFESAAAASGVNPLLLNDFAELIKNKRTGTAVIMQNLSTPRSMSAENLCDGLDERFAMNLIKDQITIRINGRELVGREKLPALQDFCVGSPEEPLSDFITFEGVERPVRYWVGFVDLKRQPKWTAEKAGIAIYAHHKLIQERPFFFNVPGKEILTRYMVGYVYADWLDELDEDLVSTDRSSLNWSAPAAQALQQWGEAKLKEWLAEFKRFRDERIVQEVDRDVRTTSAYSELTAMECDALKGLLSQIYPALPETDRARLNACEVMAKAWQRQPMRQTLKALWQNVGASFKEHGASHAFVQAADTLNRALIPEMLDLGVAAAMRLYGVRQMQSILEHGGTETHLQRLIEDHPWLLMPQWECLTKNQRLRTLCETADSLFEPGSMGEIDLADRRPDFVYLSDSSETQLYVIELKTAELDADASVPAYRQLTRYLEAIADRYPDAKIKGWLVARSISLTKTQSSNELIECKTWREVFRSAAHAHEDMLKTLVGPVYARDASRPNLALFDLFARDEVKELIETLEAQQFASLPVYDGQRPLRRTR